MPTLLVPQSAVSSCGSYLSTIVDKDTVAAAVGFAQFSGLLAGFVFAGILLLFDRAGNGFINPRTLSLFYTGFIVLGLDSYLFYAISGSDPAGVAGRRQVSTEYIISGGLLSMGSLLIIAGIGWLIRDCAGRDSAKRIVRQMPYGVAVVIALMLSLAVLDYLKQWFGDCPPSWLFWTTLFYPVLVFAVIIAVKFSEPSIAAKAAALGAEGDWPRLVLRYATYISGFFAIAVLILRGLLILTPHGWWSPPSTGLGVTVSVVALLMPAPSLVTLFTTVPPARTIGVKIPRQRDSKRQSKGRAAPEKSEQANQGLTQ